jgi:hypothetical protein
MDWLAAIVSLKVRSALLVIFLCRLTYDLQIPPANGKPARVAEEIKYWYPIASQETSFRHYQKKYFKCSATSEKHLTKLKTSCDSY